MLRRLQEPSRIAVMTAAFTGCGKENWRDSVGRILTSLRLPDHASCMLFATAGAASSAHPKPKRQKMRFPSSGN